MRAVVCVVLASGCATYLTPDGQDGDQSLLIVPVVVGSDPIPAGGGPVLLTVDGLAPSESARLIAGATIGAGPCFAAIGGACVGIPNPKLLGVAVADATGHAELLATFPSSLVAGQVVALQAVVARGPGGASSVLSTVHSTEVGAIDADGDGFDSGLDCDDGDPSVSPDAQETCNGRDDDCDPSTPEDGLVTVGTTNYATIGDAVIHTPPDGTVSVCAGRWTETLELTRSIHLVGLGGPEVTVIDGGGASAATLDLEGTGTYDIEGLTITGGAPGIQIGDGVALFLSHSVVTGNHASRGAGINDDGYAFPMTTATLEDVEISNNVADSVGGGMALGHGATTLTDVRFLDNEAGAQGGAVYVTYSYASLEVTDSVFHRNGSDRFGGALYVGYDAEDVLITRTDFGVGATENVPDDVYVDDFNQPESYAYFGADETLVCSPVTNDCS